MNQPDTETFFYFAYGSILLSRRLPACTPSARKLSVGVLKQHELRSHLAATRRFPVQEVRCGVCI